MAKLRCKFCGYPVALNDTTAYPTLPAHFGCVAEKAGKTKPRNVKLPKYDPEKERRAKAKEEEEFRKFRAQREGNGSPVMLEKEAI